MLEAIRSDRPQSNDESALWGLVARQLRGAGVFLLDTHGRIASWSPGILELLGYEESEWVGRPGDVIFTPEDRASGEPQKELDAALAHGEAADVRWHLRKDGSAIFVDGLMHCLREGGRDLGFAKIMKDATDRQVAQERLQAILE